MGLHSFLSEKTNDDDPGFLEHLEVLRSVLLKIICVYFLLCIPCWYLSGPVLDLLLAYAAPKGFKLHYFTLMEPFLTQLKVMLILALVFAIPYILWKAWTFIAPGLREEERRMIRLPVLSVCFLALGGAAVSILFIIPAMVKFSLSFAGPSMAPVIGIGDFVTLLLAVILAGMALFQFPVILYILLALGILKIDTVRRKRSHVVVVIFILAAVFSPPDVMSQLLLAIPTWILFEASLLLFSAKFRKNDPED